VEADARYIYPLKDVQQGLALLAFGGAGARPAPGAASAPCACSSALAMRAAALSLAAWGRPERQALRAFDRAPRPASHCSQCPLAIKALL
jgi:hypothetical protein